MQSNHLLLPFGNLPPIRGDARSETMQLAASGSNSSPLRNLAVLDPTPSTSREVVRHDKEIAKVTNQAYSELTQLQQVAAIAAASPQSSSSSSSPRTSRSSARATSSMFIKAKPRKQSTKRSQLEATLDRNRNALKSREVCRLLNVSQLDKLKSDTLDLERLLQAKSNSREAENRGLDDVMMGLKVEDEDRKLDAIDRHDSQTSRYPTRGKAMMISAQENEKLQRLQFKIEQEMQRTRQYELMGKQMGKMNLLSSGRSRYDSKPSTHERDDDDEDQDQDAELLRVDSGSRRLADDEVEVEVDDEEW